MNRICFRNRDRFFGILVATAVALLISMASDAMAGNPKNCWDIKHKNALAADGDYLIQPARGKAFTVYCADMDIAPKEYLTLVNTGGDFNFGQFTAGGAWPGTDMRTNYTKVRMDTTTFIIDLNDTTFSTTTGETGGYTAVPFGWAGDCITGSSTAGLSNIDLTGTPFSVNDMFVAGGWYGSGSATFNGVTNYLLWNQEVFVRSQIVDLTGGGYCGFVAPGSSDPATGSYPPRLLLKLKWE